MQAGARLLFGPRELPNPDVSIADGVVVVLQSQRQLGRVLTVRWREGVRTLTLPQTEDGGVVLNQHTIMQNCERVGANDSPFRIKSRTVENDVVGLPLAGRSAHIDQGRVLAVDCRCLPVRVGLALVGIKYLDFIIIEVHHEDPAVPSILILAVGRVGSGPFHVELVIAESLLGFDVASARNYLEIALANFPWGRPAFDRFPGGKVFAVEKNNGI